MLIKWENTPQYMRNSEVEKIYNLLLTKKRDLILKRIFDFLFSLILIILLAPFMVILSIFIKLDSKGPVFFKQIRITQYGKEFYIFKFRTMVVDAEKRGTQVTIGNDPRITKVGNLIRKTRLDELPQLFNILKGEMSFVGTRPEVPKYVSQYKTEMFSTLLLPAGITSTASVKFKDEDKMLSNSNNVDLIYIQKVLPEKMKYNLKDIEEFSMWHDIKIIISTVVEVFGKKIINNINKEE